MKNPSVRIYVNEMENNRITFEIKTGHYLKILRHETMTLLKSTKSKITKNGNGENVLHLETTEVVLVHCDIFNYNYQ